jgi:hypothetical protein
MDDKHPETTTIPSSDSSPRAAPAAQPEKPSAPPPSQLSAAQKLRLILAYRLKNTLHKTDHTLLHLARLLSTPSGTDVLLCTTSYTLTTITSAIATKTSGILLPGETLIATLPAPTSTKVLAQVVGASKALADTIADYRIFVRLWGVLGLYTWARGTWVDGLPGDASTKEKTLRGLTWASIVSCVGFQVLENGAYLSSKGALTTASWTGDVGKARENRWWLWSSRFWAVYVGIELVRLGVVRGWKEKRGIAVQGDGEKEDKIRGEERLKADKLEKWLWWKDVISNMAYAPMTVHWSLEQGLLSDWGVGACGIVAGGSLLADAWRRTA